MELMRYVVLSRNRWLLDRQTLQQARAEDYRYATQQEMGWITIWSANSARFSLSSSGLDLRVFTGQDIRSDDPLREAPQLETAGHRNRYPLLSSLLCSKQLLRQVLLGSLLFHYTLLTLSTHYGSLVCHCRYGSLSFDCYLHLCRRQSRRAAGPRQVGGL